ncbi:hypothetical protein V1478_018506 [Vespula squamosa]|uniref:Uncharacterized protein n=1 Tax=Vespula squamosa TaxID=30214 RepID=A0ABD1ZUQ8_VESSQ
MFANNLNDSEISFDVSENTIKDFVGDDYSNRKAINSIDPMVFGGPFHTNYVVNLISVLIIDATVDWTSLSISHNAHKIFSMTKTFDSLNVL